MLPFPPYFFFLEHNTSDVCWTLAGIGCSCLCTILVCASTSFQVDKEEVCLRRTIGLKKDEYFLDGKHITWVLNVVLQNTFLYHTWLHSLASCPTFKWCSLKWVTWFAGKQKLWIYWKVLGSHAQILTMLCSKERYDCLMFLLNWTSLLSFHSAWWFMWHMLIFFYQFFNLSSPIISGLFHR